MVAAPPLEPGDSQAGLLFVDDEVNILKALTRLFRSEPVRVYTAQSGEEALSLLETEPIEVIVSDQRMPGLCGVELLAKVRERRPEVLRMMLTGYTNMEVAIDALTEEQQKYLSSWELGT